MPTPEAEPDLAHAIEADPNWSESYYFNAHAARDRSGFFSRPHQKRVVR